MPPPTLTDQVIVLRTDLGKVRDELHDQGKELNKSLHEIRADFAGFHARVDTLIDDVPKMRIEFNEFRASIRTYLIVAAWGVGILSTLATGMIGSSLYLAWNASRLHSDVAQHSKQIGDLTAAIAKLDERQRPLEAALPGLVKSLEDSARVVERLVARLDRLEEGLRPLMAMAPGKEWKVLISEEDRRRDPMGFSGPDDIPFAATPDFPADAPNRLSTFEVALPASPILPQAGTALEPTLQPLPSRLSGGIEKVEAMALKYNRAKIRILFKKPESRQMFETFLVKESYLGVELKSAAIPR